MNTITLDPDNYESIARSLGFNSIDPTPTRTVRNIISILPVTELTELRVNKELLEPSYASNPSMFVQYLRKGDPELAVVARTPINGYVSFFVGAGVVAKTRSYMAQVTHDLRIHGETARPLNAMPPGYANALSIFCLNVGKKLGKHVTYYRLLEHAVEFIAYDGMFGPEALSRKRMSQHDMQSFMTLAVDAIKKGRMFEAERDTIPSAFYRNPKLCANILSVMTGVEVIAVSPDKVDDGRAWEQYR